MKVWDIDGADVMRFVLRRSEWNTLIEAIAGASAWTYDNERRAKLWDALEVLRHAEDDVPTSNMLKALTQIAHLTKDKRDNDATIIHMIASSGLPKQKDDGESA